MEYMGGDGQTSWQLVQLDSLQIQGMEMPGCMHGNLCGLTWSNQVI